MVHLATVLIAAEDPAYAQDLLDRAKRNDYHGWCAQSGAEALVMLHEQHPDIVLVGPSLGDMPPTELAARLKSDPARMHVPICLMPEKETGELAIRALQAGVDDIMAGTPDDATLAARLRPLVRLATMHAELRQRARVCAHFGIKASETVVPPPADRPKAVLIVGEQIADIRALLEAKGTSVACTDNLYVAEELLSGQNFDAAVVVAKGDGEEQMAFCAQVRNNPRLFNLPVLLVGNDGIDGTEAFRRGASRVLTAPVDPGVLTSAVMMLVRRQQLRWTIREALQETLHGVARDPLTGAYSRDFLNIYLNYRLAVSKARGRHLSLLCFYIPSVEGVRHQFGDAAADHLLVQIGQWIGGLLRAEDMTARYQGNEFMVVLPDTPLDEAEVVMQRIAGVISYTDFAVKDVYQPIKVWLQVGSATAGPVDDAAALLARARHNLD